VTIILKNFQTYKLLGIKRNNIMKEIKKLYYRYEYEIIAFKDYDFFGDGWNLFMRYLYRPLSNFQFETTKIILSKYDI